MGLNTSNLLSQILDPTPRPGLHPIPGSKPLTIEAAVCPPLLYYIALLLLPPAPPPAVSSKALVLLRNILALVAGVLFFRLPLAYHVPQSIGLTYQLGLVGLYGGCRVLDAFFISPYLFNHIPRRVTYDHYSRPETPRPAHEIKDRIWTDGGLKDPFSGNALHNGSVNIENGKQLNERKNGKGAKNASHSVLEAPRATDSTMHAGNKSPSALNPYRQGDTSYFAPLSRAISGPHPIPVYETARTDPNYPHSLLDRASWALELELSMRGMGFTWTTADVRHTRKTWLPTISNRLHSILVYVLPVQLGAWAVIRAIYTRYLAAEMQQADFNPFLANPTRNGELFDTQLTLPLQLLLTLSLGAFLMSAFSVAHSIFAIMLAPLSPHPLAFFPPLYTTSVWNLHSVRHFWSFGWHRLFARLFLVYGVWPGEWLERKLTGKKPDEPADIGKVIGAFVSSGFVHAFSVRGVLAGDWKSASGEAWFFGLNGVAVVVEGAIVRGVKSFRRKKGWEEKMWWDYWVGRVWWMSVLLWTGRNFARGWVKSSLVREMAMM